MDSLLVAQRGLKTSNDKEGEPQDDYTIELNEAMRAEVHAKSQADLTRRMHAASKTNLDTLSTQLNDLGLDSFEREMIEEDIVAAAADMAKHARRMICRNNVGNFA
eukprot:SAG11_NODE_11620_length_748_cov_1.422188_1_plen_106_part_00